jgi:hypothetical protein
MVVLVVAVQAAEELLAADTLFQVKVTMVVIALVGKELVVAVARALLGAMALALPLVMEGMVLHHQ